jgi:hypothetical protein
MRRTSNRRLRPIILGLAATAFGLAACGPGLQSDAVRSEPTSTDASHRAAQAAAAERYVDLLETRAAAHSADASHRAAQAAAAERYVDLLENRAAAHSADASHRAAQAAAAERYVDLLEDRAAAADSPHASYGAAGATPLDIVVTYLDVPIGAPVRHDAPDPGSCVF